MILMTSKMTRAFPFGDSKIFATVDAAIDLLEFPPIAKSVVDIMKMMKRQ